MAGLTINELTALTTLAATRSFRAAALELGMAPSSLSHAVASTEKRLGVRLFNRSTRSVSLTEAGEHFVARVQPLLTELSDAVSSVGRFGNTPSGLLRLNSSETGAERILPLILSFMAAYPEMRVDVVTNGRLIDIVAEGFDAGVRLGEAVPQDMVALPLGMDEAFSVVATKAYLEKHSTPRVPADLLTHECVRARLPSGAALRWEFEKSGEELRLDPPGRLIVGSPELALKVAEAGVGIAYVNARAAADAIAAGRLVRLLSDWTPPFPGVALYFPRQRLSSAGLRAFIDHVKARRAHR